MLSTEKNKTLNSSSIGNVLTKNDDYLMYYPSRRQTKTL